MARDISALTNVINSVYTAFIRNALRSFAAYSMNDCRKSKKGLANSYKVYLIIFSEYI